MFSLWKFYITFIVIFSFEVFSASLPLELRIFKVGQGNTIGLKINKNALFIDIGGTFEEGVLDQILKFKADTKSDVVLITHQHIDHYDKIQDVFIEKTPDKLIIGGKKPSKAITEATSGLSPQYFDVSKENLNSSILENVLPGVNVEFLLPNKKVADAIHCQNLIVKVTYASKSIIFPGDANDRLIKQVIKDNPDCLKNIDIVIFSHHGSNEQNELFLIDEIIKDNPDKPILGIISSDVNSSARIPKYFPNSSDDKTFLDKFDKIATLFPITIPNTKRYCAYHNISMYDKSIDEVYISPAISKDGKNIIPVFSTGDLEDSLYYKIVIQSDGKKLTMTDQSGTILYQLVDTLPLDASISQPIELVGLGISKLTRTAFIKCKVDTAKAINPYTLLLTQNISSLSSSSLKKEITALMEIQKSGYLAKVTVLDRLFELMINVFSNIQVSGDLLQYRIYTTGILESFEWANFLWCNKFFETEKLTKESLVNLVCACVPKIIPTTTTSSSSSSSSSSANPQYYTQEEILQFFKKFGPHAKELQLENGGKKRGIFVGKNLFEQMGLSKQTPFLEWVEEKLWTLPRYLGIIDPNTA